MEWKKGRQCTYKVQTKKGNTTNISNHLREKHSLKPAAKQTAISNKLITAGFESFREALAIGVAKQYLHFTFICEKSIQDSYLAFHREFNAKKMQPVFITDKTVASDIKTMADKYVNEMKLRFTSKLSLCMDVWTGPNR